MKKNNCELKNIITHTPRSEDLKFECHWEWKGDHGRTYEQDSLEYVIEHFKKQKKRDLVMIDVGAHIGYWSVQMSPYFSAIHSFECNHDLFPVLAYNTLKYDNINLYPYGLDISTEMLDFAYLPNHAEGCIGSYVIGKNEFHKLGEFHQTKDVYKELIVTVAPPRVKGPIDFIKIDVEGAEYNVLKACEKYKKYDPLIHVEIKTEYAKKKLGEYIDIVEQITQCDYIAKYKKTK